MYRILAGLAMASMFFMVGAQAQEPEMGFTPVKNVTPYSKSDEYAVLIFFKFNCPVCRSYHATLAAWGTTLPKPFHVQFVPVIEPSSTESVSRESAIGLSMYWIMDTAATPEQQTSFAYAAYSLVQDKHQGANPEAWIKAAGASGITKAVFQKAYDIESRQTTERVARQSHYKPVATPTMVVCGKSLITPDSTDGNQEMFLQLANGLVSNCMEQHGLTPK